MSHDIIIKTQFKEIGLEASSELGDVWRELDRSRQTIPDDLSDHFDKLVLVIGTAQ